MIKVTKTVQSIFVYLLSFLLTFHPILARGVIVDKSKGGKTNLEDAPNGVPVVNINTPNSNGLSHNYFDEYNVEKIGIILNNSGKEITKTQLAGLIQGNANLANGEALLILTEVTGVNRTNLEGFTEIAGKSAEYILANPNGIYVNGAGFINTPKVTLTTGKPTINSSGKLDSFDIEKGVVIIGSDGLDGTNLEMVDIISRVAELNGAIYGGEELNIILGRNKVDFDTKKVTPKGEDTSDKPKIALDGRALGSLYAGRIYILSNEKDVGVNTQGEMLAGTGDVTVDVNGNLVLKDVQSKGNTNIKGKATAITERVLSGGDIYVNSTSISNNGEIRSNNQTKITSGSLENQGEIASKTLVIKSDSVNNQGNILANELVDIQGDVKNENSGIIATEGELRAGNVTNSGVISAVNNIEVLGDISNNTSGIITSNSDIEATNVTNSGVVSNKGTITVANNLENKSLGEIVSENEIFLKNLENAGTISTQENLYISNNLNNQNTGVVVSGESVSILGNTNNSGILSSKKGLIIKDATNTGNIYSDGTVDFINLNKNSGTISGVSITINNSGKLDNKGGVIKSGIDNSNMVITATSIENTGGEILSQGNLTVNVDELLIDGRYVGNNTFEINSNNITNNGQLESLGTLKIIAKNNILNNNDIKVNNLEISSNTLSNTYTLAGKVNTTITLGSSFTNEGTINFGNKGSLIIRGNLVNSGFLIGVGDIDISGLNITNNGQIASGKSLGIKGKNIINSPNVLIYAGENINLFTTQNFTNTRGEIYSGGNLDIIYLLER